MSNNRILFSTLFVTALCAVGAYFYVLSANRSSIRANASLRVPEAGDAREREVRLAKERLQKAQLEVLRVEMSRKLSVGDSREKIERVLKERGMKFYFDQLERRYESEVEQVGTRTEWRVVMDIRLDRSDRLSKLDPRILTLDSK